MVSTPFSTPRQSGCYSFSKVSGLAFGFQTTLHGALKTLGVFFGKRAAPRTSDTSRSTLVLVLRQQRLEAGVLAQGIPGGIDSEHRHGSD